MPTDQPAFCPCQPTEASLLLLPHDPLQLRKSSPSRAVCLLTPCRPTCSSHPPQLHSCTGTTPFLTSCAGGCLSLLTTACCFSCPLLPPPPQLRKSYPLKSLHDMRVSSPARSVSGTGQDGPAATQNSSVVTQLKRQQVLELRCASHQSLPEYRAQYLMNDIHSTMFLASLIVQLLR